MDTADSLHIFAKKTVWRNGQQFPDFTTDESAEISSRMGLGLGLGFGLL